VIAIPAIIISCVALPWILIGVGVWLSPDPPKPMVRYGEFPFEIVYTLDGQLHTIEDVLVCEYDGIGADEGRGKFIQWKGYLKSSDKAEIEEVVLYRKDNIRIVCEIGSPAYYMGEDEYMDGQSVTPCLILYEERETLTISHWLSEEDEEQYHIEIISWTLSDPIVNTFE
jgi:hypothetical protein